MKHTEGAGHTGPFLLKVPRGHWLRPEAREKDSQLTPSVEGVSTIWFDIG